MIETELRSGNWLVTKPDAPFVQNYRMVVNAQAIANFADCWEGIAIDDTILLKICVQRREFVQYGNGAEWNPEYPRTVGYDYIISEQIKVQYHTFYWLDENEDIQHDAPKYAFYFEGNFIRDVEFVHILQNLVYFLTDEELIFNEKL